MYKGYEIAFYGAASWSFGNEFARNVGIFGIDDSSSSLTFTFILYLTQTDISGSRAPKANKSKLTVTLVIS